MIRFEEITLTTKDVPEIEEHVKCSISIIDILQTCGICSLVRCKQNNVAPSTVFGVCWCGSRTLFHHSLLDRNTLQGLGLDFSAFLLEFIVKNRLK
jgi:hypothetical protein